MYKDRGNGTFFAVLYQLAGDLLITIGDGSLTAEQFRLRELLLDALAEPNEFSARELRMKHNLAVMKDK